MEPEVIGSDLTRHEGKVVGSEVLGFGINSSSSEKEPILKPIGTESSEDLRAREAKATKEDDAAVPIHLWNERVISDWNTRPDQHEASVKLDVIRTGLLLRGWKINLRRSFVDYLLRTEYGSTWNTDTPKEPGGNERFGGWR
jgi:hypothetical protein